MKIALSTETLSHCLQSDAEAGAFVALCKADPGLLGAQRKTNRRGGGTGGRVVMNE